VDSLYSQNVFKSARTSAGKYKTAGIRRSPRAASCPVGTSAQSSSGGFVHASGGVPRAGESRCRRCLKTDLLIVLTREGSPTFDDFPAELQVVCHSASGSIARQGIYQRIKCWARPNRSPGQSHSASSESNQGIWISPSPRFRFQGASNNYLYRYCPWTHQNFCFRL
jgi:hypothetical protein